MVKSQDNCPPGVRERDISYIFPCSQDHLLYSPTLLDLEHGTIRHRDRELVDEGRENEVKQGYFYHAQLTDWTDG